MRVLYIVQHGRSEVPQTHVLNLVRGLVEQQDSIIAVSEPGLLTDALPSLNVPCHVLPSLVRGISPGKDLRTVIQIAHLIRATRADLVHTHTPKAGLAGRLAARSLGVPCVHTAHTWCFAEGSWTSRLTGVPIERIAGRFGSVLINVNDENRKLALRHRIVAEERMVTIWDGIPDTRYRARPSVGRVPEVITVMPSIDQAGHRTLVRVLSRTSIPARAIFIGDGLHDALKEAAEVMGISRRVDFIEPGPDLDAPLSRAHIFAQPERYESCLLTIVKAMRAGLPVIAFKAGAVTEAVIEGETGFLVEPGDEETFAGRLESLLEDPALRTRMGAAGRRRYESKFTLRRMLDRTLAVYQRAVFGAQASGAAAPRRALEDQEIFLHDS